MPARGSLTPAGEKWQGVTLRVTEVAIVCTSPRWTVGAKQWLDCKSRGGLATPNWADLLKCVHFPILLSFHVTEQSWRTETCSCFVLVAPAAVISDQWMEWVVFCCYIFGPLEKMSAGKPNQTRINAEKKVTTPSLIRTRASRLWFENDPIDQSQTTADLFSDIHCNYFRPLEQLHLREMSVRRFFGSWVVLQWALSCFKDLPVFTADVAIVSTKPEACLMLLWNVYFLACLPHWTSACTAELMHNTCPYLVEIFMTFHSAVGLLNTDCPACAPV